MNSDDVRTHQAKRIHDALGPVVVYLGRLRERMERVGFPPNDRLYLHVARAHDAARDLLTETFYLGCSGGVGRPPRE